MTRTFCDYCEAPISPERPLAPTVLQRAYWVNRPDGGMRNLRVSAERLVILSDGPDCCSACLSNALAYGAVPRDTDAPAAE